MIGWSNVETVMWVLLCLVTYSSFTLTACAADGWYLQGFGSDDYRLMVYNEVLNHYRHPSTQALHDVTTS